MGKGINIEYTIDVAKGGINSKMKMEASIMEDDLDFFVKKYGAKVIGAISKAIKSSDSKENKKSNK